MSKRYRPWKITEPMLLPATVEDFVDKDHLARFVLHLVIEEIDLEEIERVYRVDRGQPPFDPAMRTALLLYGYCNGVYSSRRIAKACRERVDFMSIVGLDPPDFRTISEFRKRHLNALSGLFGHPQHPHLARQFQHLHEQPLDLLEKPSAKRRDRIVVGMAVGGDEAERHQIVRRPLQLPAGERPRRIAVHNNAQQQSGMIRGRSDAPIAAVHCRQIQPLDHFDDETRQMSLRKPLIQRRRQKISRLSIKLAEIAQLRPTQRTAESMRRFYPTSTNALSPTGC